MRLEGQKALVTGGGRGIGRALAEQLARRGANVVIVGRDRGRMDETARAFAGRIIPLEADLSSPAEVDRLLKQVAGEHPDLSILVNNAAAQTEMNLLDGEPGGWIAEARNEIAVNLAAAISLSIGCLPLLRRQQSASLVNISTALALAPKQASPVYCATKAGLRSFTRALRYQCEAGAPQVCVTDVVMALVDTDMTRGRGRGKISPEQAAAAVLHGIASGRKDVWVGPTRFLRILDRISPRIVQRILR